jgi:putative colanic acid biosynthesis acetyltransferase WcaF
MIPLSTKTRTYQDLSQFQMPDDFRGKPAWFVQLWWIVQALLFKTSPQFMYGWRRWLLRLFGAKIGKQVTLRPSVHTQFPWKVTIGDYSWVGDDVVLYSLGEIEIGKNVVISQRSYLCTGSHDYEQISFPIYAQKIVLEDECWLATDVYVAPNVWIGRGTVVGARSSVFKNLPAGMIAVGSPAQVVRPRS